MENWVCQECGCATDIESAEAILGNERYELGLCVDCYNNL